VFTEDSEILKSVWEKGVWFFRAPPSLSALGAVSTTFKYALSLEADGRRGAILFQLGRCRLDSITSTCASRH
jgi:hypothetical protein